MKTLFKILIIFIFLIIIKANISEKCSVNEDCNHNNYCSQGKCHHKSILPLEIHDIIGFLCIIIGSALSNAGGIGGGGLFIPILILILEFYTHEAIPISKLMIFVGSVTAFILNLQMRHPSRNATPIDFNISILIIPSLLLGTVVGVSLNKVFPSIFILIMLTLVLIINTLKTGKKAMFIYKLENEDKLLKNENKEKNKNPPSQNGNSSIVELNVRNNTFDKKPKHTLNDNLVRIELEKDKKILRWDKLKFMIFSYIAMIVISLLKGSEYFKSIIGIQVCSPIYWLIYSLNFPITLIITYYAAKAIKEENKYRLDIEFPYDKTDIMWNNGMLIKYPLYGFFSGFIAGLVGIGGGLIIGPLLIEIGINPTISTVTSNFLVLFTSSSTSLQFILMGMMNISYGGICTIFSIVGSFIGTVTIHYLLYVFKRESILVIILFVVLLLSTILLPFYSLIQTIGKVNGGIDIWDFSSPC